MPAQRFIARASPGCAAMRLDLMANKVDAVLDRLRDGFLGLR